MLSYHSMTESQRELYDCFKNEEDDVQSLSDDEIGDAEAQAIAAALKVNTTLTQLDLSENQIGNVGAQAIAEALKSNKTLTSLSLGKNQTGDAGAQAIAEALKVNTTLTKLNLSWNQVGDDAAKAFAEALKVNKTLTRLKLHQVQIGDAGARAIAEALKVNKTVTELALDGNQIGDVGAQAIAEALKTNKTLTALDLSLNQIGDAGAQAITEAIKVGTTLTTLDLSNNCIDSAVAQLIIEANKLNIADVYTYGQFNPLVLSLLPRLASAEDTHTVFCLLTSGLELENQPASLPALPAEIAELIVDEAHYWQGVQHIKRSQFDDDSPDFILKVTVPQGVNGNSIRVKAIQVLRDWNKRPNNTDDNVFDLIVRDEQGAVRYKFSEKPTVVDRTLELVTILRASHPVIRQMREGWQVQVRPSKFYRNVQFESLYVGYV
ncbi:hypothetical protein CAOG_08025 [Capsaspora owczarzaki ATCC 30864]|uniref:NOD3 protein n=1 Tax=Capsaspora owczarzaki (strain ATCC 30864) TaxID=595528 RepID=A0A0D2WXK7_CAPO3|nr:hypothetical protein CAOG_08025 [Capsaspora owczarzaki ATCC 30864]KJE97960.1 hypothetical protein CAOG_008025 [Capsaspora owczarzaki ATCC 30864]|eukprot:XP_004342626.1 hypothetical protein CAOG_08025 [Capsaspora owczarzaki ATCC 30864]